MKGTMKNDTLARPSSIYLERNLSYGDRTFTETELLQASRYIVILAEPGGGKTELMNNLARRLDTETINASVFLFAGINKKNTPLLIDAVDEVATIDQSSIYRLLSEVKRNTPSLVIMSSRSSEWGQSSTIAFEQFLGSPPLIARMNEFDRQQQSEIFEFHTSGEDFNSFEREVCRFNLEMLLPNPQFLKMFADAYIESNRHFINKRSIFSLAVERLAKEANAKTPLKPSHLSVEQKIELASEAFAKLLLSASEGITTTEANESIIYPLLKTLLPKNEASSDILSTRLFRLGECEYQHRPVHKIVVEYCAAYHLIKRINNSSDPLTLWKCLPIIAPNNVARDELRGLIGWMAALGSKSIQEKLIEIDAYAVLANGDPSQLEPSSKKLLLTKLKEIQEKDPYFRRGDFWRRFSVAGFFTRDVSQQIRSLIVGSNDSHLRGLLFELISGSEVVELLANDIYEIAGDIGESDNIRTSAVDCLLHLKGYDLFPTLQILLFEATNLSLNMSAKIIEKIGIENFSLTFLSNYLKLCTHLYPTERQPLERVVGTRYFIKKFVRLLPTYLLEPLLDSLTYEITCTCGEESYECYCRLGISKIVGLIVDRYFEFVAPPYSPEKVWSWLHNLNFVHPIQQQHSKSVEVIQSNNKLRQEIISFVFGPLKDRDEIFDLKLHTFQNSLNAHSGLQMRNEDYKFIITYAFEIGNHELWSGFFSPHRRFGVNNLRGKDELRHLMRQHACSKPEFMKVWMRLNKVFKDKEKNDSGLHRKLDRKRKSYEKKRQEKRFTKIAYINENRTLIESGQHWNCLLHFAHLTLSKPDQIAIEVGDISLVRNALKNCIGFISAHVPNLRELAKLQCESKYSHYEMVLYAACLEIFRAEKSLERVPSSMLASLRTGINMGFSALTSDESELLKTEIDRILFDNDKNFAEEFLIEYVEPQLQQPCAYPEVWLLENETIFHHLRSKLALEWLEKYPDMDSDTLHILFEIAVKNSNRDSLKKLISHKCLLLEDVESLKNPLVSLQKTFWYLRDFYFNDEVSQTRWSYLSLNRENILLFQGVSDRIPYDNQSTWPELSAIKIEYILNAFYNLWPQTNPSSDLINDSSNEQKAFRFMNDLVWKINSDDSLDALTVTKRLISDPKLTLLKNALQSIHTQQVRKQALHDFVPPTPNEIVKYLDNGEIVTVESLRQLIIQELNDFQGALYGGEFNSTDRFYQNGQHLSENDSTAIIAERLNLRLEPQGISITPEHQLKNNNRSDFTATKILNGKRCLLVTEVKGQWHRELYNAASAQLYERYSIHPDAEQQGIFLVLWFGKEVAVAGKKKHQFQSAEELKTKIEGFLPRELKNLIDIFVLDVSRT